MLADELKEMGAEEVELDELGVLYATLPATVDYQLPTLCFCAHVDTSFDVSGENVQPQVHAYHGERIWINRDLGLYLDENELPYLAQHRGHNVVTASGGTLLGADDKAGVAAIMDAAAYLLRHPEIPHGKIRLLFTPDEEIGRGADGVRMEKLGADFGYTLDGAEAGSIETESFSADSLTVNITGISAHPGYAYKKMLSALKAAAYMVDQLPKDRQCPECTRGREGFAHPVHMSGSVEQAVVQFILRDFDTAMLDQQAALVEDACAKTRQKFEGISISLLRREQYRNMGEVLQKHPQVFEFAKQAIEQLGMEVKVSAIRGGTDGSRLSFMGMPCANLFTGMQLIHSQREWVSERDLNLAAETIVELVQVWARELSKS